MLDTTYAPPTGGTLRTPTTSAQLQAELDAAQPGDIIQLQAGTTYVGNFVLKQKSGSAWIYIRTSAHASLPAPGNRVGPSHASLMPKLVSNVTNMPALRTQQGAHHYRLVGIEITATPTVNNMVHIEGFTGTNFTTLTQTQVSHAPSDIVFDRVYVHGNAASPNSNYRRGILLNAVRGAVIDSYISDFRDTGSDSQAIAVFNGPGPLKIANNYLSGAGENVMFGGSDPTIPNLVPSDIEVRGNHMFKPFSWQEGHPSYTLPKYVVKNIFELKNAQRILIEGNVFENNWGQQGQAGTAIVFTPRNQSGGCNWCVVQDVTFQKNIVKRSPAGIKVAGTDDGDGQGYPSLQTKRVLLKDNLLLELGIGEAGIDDNRGLMLLNADSPVSTTPGGIEGLIVDHNTVRVDIGAAIYFGSNQDPFNRHASPIIRNNIFERANYGIFGDGVGEGTTAFNTYTTTPTLTKTLIIGASSSSYSAVQPGPCGTSSATCYPASDAAVNFVDAAGGDFRLCSTSIAGCSATSAYKNAGTDGKDLGADIAAVNAATAGAISGTGSSSSCGTQLPYSGSAIAVPSTFPAENFDLGCEGVAYHDVVAGNAGGQYRPNEDVDIIAATGNASGFVVNNFESTEWLEYTINVATAGMYAVEVHASSAMSTGVFHVEIDGVSVGGSVTVPNTGAWSAFQYVPTAAFNLSAGQHVLRLVADQQYFNVDAIRLVSAGTVLLSDNFTGNGAPSSSWTIGTFTGTTQDLSIPVARVSDVLQIGPLSPADTWNGIYSSTSYPFTNGAVQVKVVQTASASGDFTMFAAGNDVNNFYRAHINGTTLTFEKKIGGTKTTLFTTTYNPTQHRFLRIAHVGSNVVFSAAPAGGSWASLHSETWNTSAIPLATVRFELKAGAAVANSATRSAQFDDFLATTP